MELLANDLSLHRQFHEPSSFLDAFAQLMAMREVARRFERDVYCHRALLLAEPIPGMRMQQALQHFPEAMRRATLGWLTRGGPFWDDVRRHGSDDWLECRGNLVTDSAVGEAAYRSLHGVECSLISIQPSDWNFSPLTVIWRREHAGLEDRQANLENWREVTALEERLRAAAPPIRSWDDLRRFSLNRYASLTFAADCFEPLAGIPFAKAASERIIVLLDILNRFTRAFDGTGTRTPEGQRIYQDYFTGDNALFSDSSESEKREFQNELTFVHPNDPRESLFCTWHGKVRHMTLRLHYSWSGRAGEPAYIVYIGNKITRR